MGCAGLAYRIALSCLVLLAWLVPGAAAERRVALVIGNSGYRNAPTLANPARDAKAVAAMFKAAGFDSVELRLDLESLELKRAVRGFLQSASESEIAVVFFAGHGVEVNGQNFIIPIDARMKTDFDAEDEGVALERLMRAVEPARRLRLVILDACRDNPFLNTMQRAISMRAVTAGLGKVEPEVSDTLVAFAAKAGSVARDGESEHSPFTTALLKHLPTPGLDIRIAFGRVRDDVMQATGGAQEPFVYGSLGGSTISLVPEAVQPPKPAVVVKDPDAPRRDYELAERIGTPEAWGHFLKAHPDGFLADLARTQLTARSDAQRVGKSAAVDVSRPETRRPTLTPPAPVAEPAKPMQAPDPARAEASRPGKSAAVDLALPDFRKPPAAAPAAVEPPKMVPPKIEPQRIEPLKPVQAPEPPRGEPERPGKSAAVDLGQPEIKRPPLAPPPPSVTIEAVKPAPSPAGGPESCRRDAERLARLRAEPVAAEILKFSRDLSCETLRPQLTRLIESSDLGQPAPRPMAPAAPSRPVESRPKAPPPAPAPEPVAALPAPAPAAMASARSSSACIQEARTLDRLRGTPTLESVDAFARAMTCTTLKPQVMRLRESLQD